MAGRIPRWALTHRVIVEPYLGATGRGPAYGPPVRLRCHIEWNHRTKRSTAQGGGRGTGDESTAWFEPDAIRYLIPESRLTVEGGRLVGGAVVGGRTTEIHSVRKRDFGAARTPNHVEVAFT